MASDDWGPWDDNAINGVRRDARNWQESSPSPRRYEEPQPTFKPSGPRDQPVFEPPGSHEPAPPYRDPWLTSGFFAHLAEDAYAETVQRRQPPKRGLLRRIGNWLARPFARRPARTRGRH
jgi:hypothetical protein